MKQTLPSEDPWSGLLQPRAAELVANVHPDCELVYVALDERGRRHLLVEVPAETRLGPLARTQCLLAEVIDLALGSATRATRWADVSCVEPDMNETFAHVAIDLADAVETSPRHSLTAVMSTLERWKRFWGNAHAEMSLEREVGLFGELWFLSQWLNPEEAVRTWVGPLKNRHDFASDLLSVEVKTALSTGASGRHRITSLDQLADPESGNLLFFSLQVTKDAASKNSVSALVRAIRKRLPESSDLLTHFENLLAECGWSPSTARSEDRTFRVLSQRLYAVRVGFPRLTMESVATVVPSGVSDISYTIDTDVCPELLLATDPDSGRSALVDLRS